MNDTPELFSTSAHSRDKPPGKIGGCVGTFLQLFDWNPRKRLFSTKRLPAERPNARPVTAGKKKYKDERMPVAKLLLLAEEENRGGFPSPKKISSASSGDRLGEDGAGGNKRVPGVVARLMGLESLPDERSNVSPGHAKLIPPVEVRPLQELLHTRQEPHLLSDLLREREYLEAKKSSSKDRPHVPVPGFVKKLPESAPHMNYMPPKDGFKKSLRNDSPHLQPYSDPKYHKSLRPLKRTSRDLTDPKHLILALSPRASGDGLRPILLPSKAHNKLMNSPVKSPTKMGSRSARLLEAAVKILEPSLQSSTARARVPPARPSSVREFKEAEREAGILEERRDRLGSMVDGHKKAAAAPHSSNAARALKGQNMSRSWNGREEAGKYGGSSLHEPLGRRRNEQQSQVSQSRAASPMSMRAGNRARNGGNRAVSQDDLSMKMMEDIRTVVPQGFEENYGVGLKPLIVGRRENEVRLDKYEIEDRRAAAEKHVVSSLSSLSSLSLGNSPYSECSERSTTSSFHDPLRRSGSVKEGPPPSTPAVSKSRFMRSKSVKEEKSSKLSSGIGGAQGPSYYSRSSTREVRVKLEIPQQAHQVHQQQAQQQQQQAQRQAHHQSPPPAPLAAQEPPKPEVIATRTAERDSPFQEPEIVTVPKVGEQAMAPGQHQQEREREVLPKISNYPKSPITQDQQLPKISPPEVEVSVDESASSPRSSHASSGGSHGSSVVITKDVQVPPRSNTGGGLLSYSRLFGSRKSGDRKSDSSVKESKTKAMKSESSLVRTLLRRKPSPQSSSPTPAPVQSMDKPKRRGGKRSSLSEPPSREASDAEPPGYFSEDYSMEPDLDVASAIQAKLASKNEDHRGDKERVIHHPDGESTNDSPSRCVDDVFPEVPLDKGCLRLLDDMDERGSQRMVIEGFDCVEDDNSQDERTQEGISTYAAHLMDDLKLEEMFTTGTVIQGSGRNGFSYSPLVELEDDCPRSSLENFILDGGAEVEKCVSFLGRTGDVSSSPEMSFVQRELLAEEEEEGQDVKPMPEQRPRIPLMVVNDGIDADIEEAKATLLNELSEARKIVDHAFDECTERVAKKLASSKGRVALAGVVDGDEAVCASAHGNDDCGQPSPISVLDCPFEEDESRSSQGNLHESVCETEEEEFDDDDVDVDSLIDDLLYESAATTVVDTRKGAGGTARKKVTLLSVTTDADSTIGKTQNEKIVDAILDISRIRCIDPSACGLLVENSESFHEEEEEYVRKILSVWEVLPEASGNGAAAAAAAAAANGAELPIASTLFDRLESQGRASAWKREKDMEEFGSASPEEGAPPVRSFKQWQGLWLHRRLLFDCVNETLAYSLKFRYPEPWLGIPILRPPPTGHNLVKEVYSEMKDWRDVQTEELDTIIEMDMGRGFGNWSNLNQEIAEIGLEIERSLLRVLIEELVSEIMGVTSLPKCHPPLLCA